MGNGFNGSLIPSRENGSGEQIGMYTLESVGLTDTVEVVEGSEVGVVVVIITLVVTVILLTGIQAKLVLSGFG